MDYVGRVDYVGTWLFFEAEGFFQAGEEVGDDQGWGLQLFFQIPLYFTGVNALEHVVEFGVWLRVFDSMMMDIAEKGKSLGNFPFGNFVNLEVDFFTQRINICLAVLTHEDENGQKNSFQGDKHSQKGEGKRIEFTHEQKPENKKTNVKNEEDNAAGGSTDIIGQSFCKLTVLLKFGF
ncbi:MAG: hypothetical protein G01um101416_1140 [Microgenomates group bacterium Gr01-1014_16]|nr:MAG: hypothetical protein G01um101416_1140 [Microgenomates group bacterium Gr01-1014_16]